MQNYVVLFRHKIVTRQTKTRRNKKTAEGWFRSQAIAEPTVAYISDNGIVKITRALCWRENRSKQYGGRRGGNFAASKFISSFSQPILHPASRAFSYGTYPLYLFFRLLSAQKSDKRGSARRVPILSILKFPWHCISPRSRR